jgi:SAM-dependent methyltransferase
MTPQTALEHLLCCPDDRHPLLIADTHLECTSCGRRFRRFGERVLEIVSREPASVPRTLLDGYRQIHKERFRLDTPSTTEGWGYLPSVHPGYRGFVRAERDLIGTLLADCGGVLVDVSGGVGNYSAYLSQFFAHVIHCELHVPSLVRAIKDVESKSNVLFVRSDYLALPIADASADAVICIDTLERGPEHEKALLREISRIMKPSGVAIVDFHNDRLRWAREKSKDVMFYELSRFKSLLHEVGFSGYSVEPLGYVPMRFVPNERIYPLLDKICSLLVPASRYLLRLFKPKS